MEVSSCVLNTHRHRHFIVKDDTTGKKVRTSSLSPRKLMLHNNHPTHNRAVHCQYSVTNVTDFLLPIFTGGQDTTKSLININLSLLANRNLV